MPAALDSGAAIANKVLGMADYTRRCRAGYPAQGQFVTTAFLPFASAEQQMGFCVQVRKGRGQFGSDMVFLRHPAGGLTTHENQSFNAMTDEQEAMARSLFESENLPEAEDYSRGYSCYGKVHEVGFLIEDSKSEPKPDVAFSFAITKLG